MLKLIKLKYSERDNNPQEWALEEFDLSQTNLLVGKNATGKTRTLKVISGLTRLLSGQLKKIFSDANYKAQFEDKKDKITYELIIKKEKVQKELLTINGKEKISRGEAGVGKIFVEKLKENIDFKVDENKLAVVEKRDEIQHPFLENLILWGKNALLIKFGSNVNQQIVIQDKQPVIHKDIDLHDKRKVLEMFLRGKKLDKKFTDTIKKEMKVIGYKIKSIGPEKMDVMMHGIDGEIPATVKNLAVREIDLKGITNQHQMSAGMFRVLSLLIQIKVAKLIMSPSLIMIDDIGEGLDYSRSTQLIKLLMEETKNSPVQLIMSTNDRFIMNIVPIEFWALIKRTGSTCKVFNHINSKQIF